LETSFHFGRLLRQQARESEVRVPTQTIVEALEHSPAEGKWQLSKWYAFARTESIDCKWHNRRSMSRERQTVSFGRHQRNCSVCAHEQRKEIEAAFIGWRSPAAIAEEFGLADRSSVYRHANALGLFPKRQRNIRAALERIIEKAGEVDVTASAVVAAIQAYAKINAAGEWIDRTETISLNDLFERMSTQELEAYAQTGALPEWFKARVDTTDNDRQERLIVDNN
jgi:hypothetical protein